DWEVSTPATWTYIRTTGLLSQSGTLQIKLKSGNSVLITAFSDLQVVAPSATANQVSYLYVDFDTPSTNSNIIGTINVSHSNSMPELPDNKSRIILGYSILIT